MPVVIIALDATTVDLALTHRGEARSPAGYHKAGTVRGNLPNPLFRNFGTVMARRVGLEVRTSVKLIPKRSRSDPSIGLVRRRDEAFLLLSPNLRMLIGESFTR